MLAEVSQKPSNFIVRIRDEVSLQPSELELFAVRDTSSSIADKLNGPAGACISRHLHKIHDQGFLRFVLGDLATNQHRRKAAFRIDDSRSNS